MAKNISLVKSTLKLLKRILKKISQNFAFKKVYIELKTANEDQLFDNKLIVVTGGGSGIGLAITEKLVKSGGCVVICGRDIEKLKAASENISSKNLSYQVCDIANSADIKRLLINVKRKYDKEIDIFINAAAVFSGTQFEEVTEDEWDKIYKVNSRAVFFMFQKILSDWTRKPVKCTRKIINISSQAANIGATYPYRLTKWDVTGLTEGLAKKYAYHNILINSVAPGIILTDMQKHLYTLDENYKNERVPIQRSGSSYEIAELVCFIASDRCNFLTGQTIFCDGGYSLR